MLSQVLLETSISWELHHSSSTSPPQIAEACKCSRIGHLVGARIRLFCLGVDSCRSDLDLLILLDQGTAGTPAGGAEVATTPTINAVLLSERCSVDALKDT